MALNTRAFALTAAIVWGGCLLLTALANRAFPPFGSAWLQLAGAIYPGYHGSGGWDAIILVTVYGLVDGALTGAIIAWLYNSILRRVTPARSGLVDGRH